MKKLIFIASTCVLLLGCGLKKPLENIKLSENYVVLRDTKYA